jgi:hypothetical protein
MSAPRFTVHTTPVGTHFVFDTVSGRNTEFPKGYADLGDVERRAEELNTVAEWWVPFTAFAAGR